MSVDLWMMGNVAIHLRHPPSRGALLRTGGYGGQDVANFQFSIPMRNGEALGVGWRLELVQEVWKVLNFLNILNFLNSYFPFSISNSRLELVSPSP